MTTRSRSTNPTPASIGAPLGLIASVLFVAGHAHAQGEPTVAWRVEVPGILEVEPSIGPDGEVAVQGLELVVVEPDGSVRFRNCFDQFQNTLRTDIGPDGVIYATSLDGPVALAPDGRELWRTSLPDGMAFHDPMAGPTVGPDGNIYYAGDIDVGLASLTPDGDLRWRRPVFGRRITLINDVHFFDGTAIFTDTGLAEGPGVIALSMDNGSTEWFTRISGVRRGSQMTGGDIVTGQQPPDYTRLDPSSGDIIPTALPTQTVTSWDVTPGPDGVGYSVGSLQKLLRIPTSGTIELVGRMPLAATAGAALTPDSRTLIMGLAESILPSQAFIAGVDPDSADLRWTIALPQEEGSFLRVSGIPAITADGARAYVPVLAGTLARGNVSYLYAIDLRGGGPCRADLDGDGTLTIFDFLAFQNLFDAGDPAADFDGDGELTLFDFLAFQNAFDAGC